MELKIKNKNELNLDFTSTKQEGPQVALSNRRAGS
jgi:hypothetical protein